MWKMWKINLVAHAFIFHIIIISMNFIEFLFLGTIFGTFYVN